MSLLCRVITALILCIAPSYADIFLEKPEDFNPRVEVVGCFLEYQDKILVLHRQDHTSEGNKWGIPGGKLERGETPLQAAVREISEETGFDISCIPIEYWGKVYIKYPKFDYIYHMIRCKPQEAPQQVAIHFKEHKGFTWITPEDALKMDLMRDEDPCIRLVYDL
ncbi:MAG: NUDIX hydrolase [Chlamydiales bacterium]|nr:NUDIX hydrolase [Chlamydiales bacterium]